MKFEYKNILIPVKAIRIRSILSSHSIVHLVFGVRFFRCPYIRDIIYWIYIGATVCSKIICNHCCFLDRCLQLLFNYFFLWTLLTLYANTDNIHLPYLCHLFENKICKCHDKATIDYSLNVYFLNFPTCTLILFFFFYISCYHRKLKDKTQLA